jgi:hypothetical protein
MGYKKKLCRDVDDVSTRVLIGVEPIASTNKFTIRFRGTAREGAAPGKTSDAFPPDYSFGFSSEADAIRTAEQIIERHQLRGYLLCPDAPDEEFPRW